MLDKKILNKIPKQPQRQDSLFDQLQDMKVVATILGCYDVADLISTVNENYSDKKEKKNGD